MLFKSRNTMVTSAVLFLIVVILLRLSGGFFEDNIVRVVGAIFGGSAENIPLLDFGSIDLSWLNPDSWSMSDMMSGINGWLHQMIDSVLPAFISFLNVGMITVIITQYKLMSAATVAGKAVPFVL